MFSDVCRMIHNTNTKIMFCQAGVYHDYRKMPSITVNVDENVKTENTCDIKLSLLCLFTTIASFMQIKSLKRFNVVSNTITALIIAAVGERIV